MIQASLSVKTAKKVRVRAKKKPSKDSMETALYQQESNSAPLAECVSSVELDALKANASGHGHQAQLWMILPPSAVARSAPLPISCSDSLFLFTIN